MRIKFNICYDGSFLNGWHGVNGVFIKNILEDSFFKLTNEKVEFFCSGRTDSGVHAINQICHCDYIKNKLDLFNIKRGMNFYLPKYIRIINVEYTTYDFHSRFSNQQRTYMYMFYYNNDRIEIPFLKNKALYITKDINIELIEKIIPNIIGMHDFSTFCPTQYTGRKIRTLDKCYIIKENDIFNNNIYKLFFTAKAFAYHQIRNLSSLLLDAGQEKISYNDFIKKFNDKNRNSCGRMLPAFGLYFYNTIYI